jgi:hypothetical protein
MEVFESSSMGDRWLRLVEAIAVYELATGAALVWWRSARRVPVLTAGLLCGFVAFDAKRALMGDTPDCNCVGAIQLAATWWHVIAKHAMLIVLFVVGMRGHRRAPLATAAAEA